MGTSSSHFIDFATEHRIKTRAHEILKLFAVEFSQAYTQTVVKRARKEEEEYSVYENGRVLHQAPVSAGVLRSGVLFKRGVYVKNWRQRFVVVNNEVENFRVDYYEGISDKGKLKGSINCAGYMVIEFSPEEREEFGQSGIKLVPRSSRRRTWYLKCLDEADRETWFLVFSVACFRSRPVRDPDDCIADAFDASLRTVRWRCGIWGGFLDGGKPAERLLELLYDVLDEEYAQQSRYAALEARSALMHSIQKSLEASLKQSCETSWLTSASSIRSMADVIEVQVHSLCTPLTHQIHGFKSLIAEHVGGSVEAFLREKQRSQLQPVFAMLRQPILQAFLVAAKMFHAEIKERLSRGDFSKDHAEDSVSELKWAIDSWTHPIVRKVDEQLCLAYRGGQREDFDVMIQADISPFRLVGTVVNSVACLLQRAVHTFSTFAADIVDSEHEQVLAHVLGLFLHDSVDLVRATILEVLRTIVEVTLEEKLLGPCQRQIAVLQDSIEALDDPSIATFLDLDWMLEEVVTEMELDMLTTMAGEFVPHIRSEVIGASEELGVPLITLWQT